MEIEEIQDLNEEQKRDYRRPEILAKEELKVDLQTNALPDEPPPPM